MKINRIVLSILTLILLVTASCSSSSNHVVVRIPVQLQSQVNFEKPGKIFYQALTLENLPGKYDPRPLLDEFFIDEFAKIIDKKVEPLEKEKNQERLNKHPDAMLISGKIVLDIKDRSIIKKIKDKSGKKGKGFVSIQHWEMNMEILLTLPSTNKTLHKKTYTGNIKEAEPGKIDFNFKSLFNDLTDSFIKEVTKKKKFEERILLLK